MVPVFSPLTLLNLPFDTINLIFVFNVYAVNKSMTDLMPLEISIVLDPLSSVIVAACGQVFYDALTIMPIW